MILPPVVVHSAELHTRSFVVPTMSGQPSGIVYYHPPTPSSQTTIAIDHDSAPQACLRHPSIWMTHHKHSPSSAAILTHTCTRHTHMHCRHPTSSPVICCHYRGHTTIHNHHCQRTPPATTIHYKHISPSGIVSGPTSYHHHASSSAARGRHVPPFQHQQNPQCSIPTAARQHP